MAVTEVSRAGLTTFSAFGCYGMAMIIVITAQDTVLVTDLHPVPPE